MKVDRFFRDISHIDDKITNIDSEINYIFSDSVKDINFKTFLENLKNKIEEEIKTYDKNYIEKEELVEYIKDNIKEIKNIDLNRIIKLENDINDLEKNIKDIKNKEIKDLYLVNINALKTNLS
jgi:septal ring factor EnvC (AmiA/AmiB activator)